MRCICLLLFYIITIPVRLYNWGVWALAETLPCYIINQLINTGTIHWHGLATPDYR